MTHLDLRDRVDDFLRAAAKVECRNCFDAGVSRVLEGCGVSKRRRADVGSDVIASI